MKERTSRNKGIDTADDPQRGSIESLAAYVLEKYHPGSELHFNKQVVRLGGTANFLLLIHDKEGRLIRVYMAEASPEPIKKDEQPFHAGIMGYFRHYKTDPAENYYFIRLQVDEHFHPIAIRSIPLPEFLRS